MELVSDGDTVFRYVFQDFHKLAALHSLIDFSFENLIASAVKAVSFGSRRRQVGPVCDFPDIVVALVGNSCISVAVVFSPGNGIKPITTGSLGISV